METAPMRLVDLRSNDDARNERHDLSQRRFSKLGIQSDRPGFYDSEAFVAAEKRDPELLEEYAWFVMTKPFSAEYVARCRSEAKRVAAFLYERLRADGRMSACVDVTLTASRFLERRGIWNVIQAGGLSIQFPPSGGGRTRRMAPIMLRTNAARTGHAWLSAPPFTIVDLAVRLQPYKAEESALLPEYTLMETSSASSFDAEDLVDPPSRDLYRRDRGREIGILDIDRGEPGLTDRIRRLGPIEFTRNGVRFRYVPCFISAPDSPLERARNLVLSGRTPAQLYADYIAGVEKPK